MKTRDIILIISGLSFLALIISIGLLLGDKFHATTCGCPKVISQNFVYLFIILSVIFVAGLFYFLFSLRIDTQKKTIDKNMEILYKILDDDEKAILKKIVQNKGELQQSDTGFDKLKSHRTIKKLIDKGIVDAIKDGKTNKITLKKELREELK